MADISKLEQQANLLMSNVSGWETSTLERIGKRIKKYGKLSMADVKSINNIAEIKSISNSTIKNLSNATGLKESEIIKVSKATLSAKEKKIVTNELNKAVVNKELHDITKELANVTGYNISQIEQMYGELLEEQHLSNQPLYDYRGVKFVPYSENKSVQSIVNAFARTTGNTMINLSSVTAQNLGFLNKSGKFVPIQKMYTDALDKAVVAISSGATDFHSAMRDTIIEMGGSGIRVNYGSGITRRLDTVVRQAMLYGAKQCSIEYNEMIGEELGCDGVEVDAHSNPRESHRFMQGQQYSLHGKKTINGVVYEDFEASGASSALQDYGCLHYRTPILLGISEPRFSKKQLAEIEEQNNKEYTIGERTGNRYFWSQRMRNLESATREQKTIRDLARSSGDKVLVKKCNEKIKAYRQKYDEIAEATGLYPDTKRMSVPRKPKT